MAEFVLKDMVRQEGIAEQFLIQSAATSTEEIWNGIGNPVYPPAREELRKHGISCEGKRAVQVTKKDYGKYDYIFGMDQRNMRNMLRIFGGDPAGKVRPLLEMAGRRGDIADPWYTGNFQLTYSDIEESCKGFLQYLRENGKING